MNTDAEIKQHLTFNDELIEPRNNSSLGLKTIQKYRLDSPVLDNRRLQSLKNFLKLIYAIKDNQVKEERQNLTLEEINAIHRFENIDNSFSMMHAILIERLKL